MKDDLSGSQAFSEQVVQPTMRVSSKTTVHDLMCLKRAAKHLRTAVTLLECTEVNNAFIVAEALKGYERLCKEMAL